MHAKLTPGTEDEDDNHEIIKRYEGGVFFFQETNDLPAL
jgi:hypothetical protein